MNAMGFQNMLWSQTRTDANTVNVNITYANQTRVTGNINSNITINPFNLSGFTNYMIGNNDKNISINNTDVDTDTIATAKTNTTTKTTIQNQIETNSYH